jgi:phosphatidylinositol-binding clathrin assembly protein
MIGYHAPANLQRYAIYLDSRIRCYRELKHDPVRVQSETNRDIRASAALDDGDLRRSSLSKAAASSNNNGNLSRSKTLAGRKLRVMSVEKGLLRETRSVQKTIDALVECRVSAFLTYLVDMGSYRYSST